MLANEFLNTGRWMAYMSVWMSVGVPWRQTSVFLVPLTAGIPKLQATSIAELYDTRNSRATCVGTQVSFFLFSLDV